MRRSPRTTDRGFTLIEMLLVIAILALLAGMIFPMASQVIARTETMKCMSNLRQIGVAANAAANDNDYRYPFVEIDPKNPIFPPEVGALPLSEAFTKYGITPAVLQCPADLKGPNWFAQTGASYMWQPYTEDEAANAVTIYLPRGEFQGRLSRIRFAIDYEAVHAGTPGGRKKSNILYADGHVTLR